MEVPMIRASHIVGIAVLFFMAAPADAAITVKIAKECRALMIKSHPTEAFGPHGSADAQRSYFSKCVRQHMAQASKSTTGSGQ
jgi:ABC-type Co2+ transport system permease subunit